MAILTNTRLIQGTGEAIKTIKLLTFDQGLTVFCSLNQTPTVKTSLDFTCGLATLQQSQSLSIVGAIPILYPLGITLLTHWKK